MENKIFLGDNLPILESLFTEGISVDLIYTKPPNIGLEVFKDNVYQLASRMELAYDLLSKNGTLYLHSNNEIVHYIKVEILDEIFDSRDCFVNEIIWNYEKTAPVEKKWTPKHDSILMYVKDPSDFTFNTENMDRVDYLAPGLVSKEKEKKGKLPTDTWWYTNIEGNGKESRSSSQLPLQMIKRIILASSDPGDLILDFYAREGKVGEACLGLEKRRNFILIDKSKRALNKMAKKFGDEKSIEWINYDSPLLG
ncbi:MAG: site-specific DNA-methyltransferase [Anaerolineales bacterium]|jgi:site-specific DNA-methyltransferase (adenine-specific)